MLSPDLLYWLYEEQIQTREDSTIGDLLAYSASRYNYFLDWNFRARLRRRKQSVICGVSSAGGNLWGCCLPDPSFEVGGNQPVSCDSVVETFL